jgi:hypothetical protein
MISGISNSRVALSPGGATIILFSMSVVTAGTYIINSVRVKRVRPKPWFNMFRLKIEHAWRAAERMIASRPWRLQERACQFQRVRNKRKRFIQQLRTS